TGDIIITKLLEQAAGERAPGTRGDEGRGEIVQMRRACATVRSEIRMRRGASDVQLESLGAAAVGEYFLNDSLRFRAALAVSDRYLRAARSQELGGHFTQSTRAPDNQGALPGKLGRIHQVF